MANPLSIWTICKNPSDHPGKFTARRHEVFPGRSSATQHLLVADSLEAIRALLPPGLYLIPREPNDDPVIVESWI